VLYSRKTAYPLCGLAWFFEDPRICCRSIASGKFGTTELWHQIYFKELLIYYAICALLPKNCLCKGMQYYSKPGNFQKKSFLFDFGFNLFRIITNSEFSLLFMSVNVATFAAG